MFTSIRHYFDRFLNNSRKVNNEPLNKFSLIVIIFVDIFILINVFIGLNDISNWHISPYQTYPCYTEWENYQKSTNKDKDYQMIADSFSYDNTPRYQRQYQQIADNHLGQLSEICLNYGELKDGVLSDANYQDSKKINSIQGKISNLEAANTRIRNQYDSTLLEKIAGQSPENSINQVGAEKAKQELDKNTRQIANLKKEIADLKQQIVNRKESSNFLALLKDKGKLDTVAEGYKSASFWYPSIQFAFQAMFLIPLIIIGLLVHRFSQNRGYGLVALISWHLLVVFFIPLLLKVLEFLQVGVVFNFLYNVVARIFGGLLFLVSYLYILFIPLFGWMIIKVCQGIIFNRKTQAAKRVQKSQCINCGKNIKSFHAHCPHCGYYQYVECHNCHELTYKKLPYCYHCGTEQNFNEEVGMG
ncbi:MAG: hypothetical protein EAZ76_13020 [Nostocales cyanobacterium]|nr:MAG: hypothetical protein EAZ87_19540 [Nostocales cyanobacterium]TAF12856.1 MAG: hypothetical protein EAZ76_13020 [Nostocales cyanobacterium]